jgi:hypothetical protein
MLQNNFHDSISNFVVSKIYILNKGPKKVHINVKENIFIK